MKRLLIMGVMLIVVITAKSQTTIELLSPENDAMFRKGSVPRLRWLVANRQSGDKAFYTILVKKVSQEQSIQEAFVENDTFFVKQIGPITSTGEIISTLDSLKPFQTKFVWGVKMLVINGEDSVEIHSDLGYFWSPLVVETLFAGNKKIYLDTGSSDLDNYWGRGYTRSLLDSGDTIQLEMENLTVKESSGLYFLQTGSIYYDTAFARPIVPREPEFGLDTMTLETNSIIINSSGVAADVGLDVKLEGLGLNSTIDFNGRVSFNEYYYWGSIYQSDTIDIEINELNQQLSFDSCRVFINSTDWQPYYTMYFNGTTTNDYLKKAKDSSFIEYTWESENQLNYLELENDDRDTLALFSELGTSFRLGSAILDMNDTMSHESKPKEWKGLLSNSIDIIQDGQLTQYDSVGLFSVDSSGMHLEISYGLSQEKIFAQIPYSHGFDSVSYSLQGAGVVSGALFGSLESELYAEEPIELYYTIDSSEMSMFPNMILGEDTLVFSAPYIEEPFDIYGDSVSLVWYNMGEQFTYQIDISKDTFNTFAHEYENFVVEDSTVQLIELDPLTTYQYRIRAYDGETLYSKTPEELIFSFTTGEEIEIVILSEEFKSLTLYPNPTKGLLHLNRQNLSGAYEYNVYDLIGRKVLTRGSIKGSTIDITSLSKGVYVIQVLQNEKEITRQRVIKE